MAVVPLADARQQPRSIDSAVRTHERIEVTRNGRRAAVILAAEEYDSLLETPDALRGLSAMVEIAAHRAAPDDVVSFATIEAELRDTGFLPS